MSDHFGDIADQIGTRGPSAADDDGSDVTTTDPDPTQPTDRSDSGGTSTDRARRSSGGSSRSQTETVRGDVTIGGARSVERAAQLDQSDFDFTSPRSGATRTVERAAQIEDVDFTPTGISGARTVERAAQIDQSDADFGSDNLGTIADARIPGTDMTVLDAADRGDSAFRDRVVEPVAATGRRAGEADIPVGPGGAIEGSEERGQLGEDFGRSAAQALNLPGFAGGVLRAGPRIARAQGDPDAARRAASAGADLGREGATFARENPLRAGAIGGGFLAGAGAVTGTARATRAGARRARESDFDFDLSGFAADTRAQTGAGRTRGRTEESGSPSTSGSDSVTISADDLSPTAATADPTRGGRFGTRPTAGRHPQDPGRTVDPPSGAGTSISTEGRGLGFRTARTEQRTAQIPRDPLDTGRGGVPTGESLGGLLGFSDAAAAGFAGLSTAAQLGGQGQAQTPAVTDGFETPFELRGTGATGTGTDTTPETGTGTDTDPFAGAGADSDIASMIGIGGRTDVGTRTGTQTAQRTAQQQTPALQDPTLSDPTQTGFRPIRTTTRTPPRTPPEFPVPEADTGEIADPALDRADALFDTGIADPDDLNPFGDIERAFDEWGGR